MLQADHRLFERLTSDVRKLRPLRKSQIDYTEYRDQPVRFLYEQLDFRCTPQQAEIATCLLKPPYRVLAMSANGQGKSAVASMLSIWWFWTRKPAKVITTAPTKKAVKDIIWGEIRAKIQEKFPDIASQMNQLDYERGPEDFMVGMTAKNPTAFQGRHGSNLFFCYDEACHDDKTDVMTDKGWLKFSELDGTEKFLTMNPETHISEYIAADKIVKKEYCGELYEYITKGVNFCVTPGHNMYYAKINKNRKTGKFEWSKRSMEELVLSGKDARMTRTVIWKAEDKKEFVIPAYKSKRKSFGEIRVDYDLFMEFMGWYLSEGHITKVNGVPYGIGISQNEGENLDRIFYLASQLGLNPKKHKTGSKECYSVLINSAQIGNFFAQFGASCLSKSIPDFVRNSSVRQIEIFLSSFLKGDGYRNRNRDIFYTSSEKMADGLQELIIKTGKDSHVKKRKLKGVKSDLGTHIATSSVDGYAVSRADRSWMIEFENKKVKKKHYEGFVYCAALPKYHLLLTRRNGNVIWSGNTGIDPGFFEVANTMFKGKGHAWLCLFNPTDTATQIYQEVCNSTRSDGTKSWHLVRMSALEHPNIIAGLQGLEEPIPNACRLESIENQWMDWCNLAGPNPNKTIDVQWPPVWATDYIKRTGKQPRWYTPGPYAESRILARYPRSMSNNIWSDGDFDIACRTGLEPLPIPKDVVPHIGCDTAREGDDFSVIHTRCGPCSLSHYESNGLRETQLAGWVIDTARHLASWYNSENRTRGNKDTITEFDIPIKLDDSPTGGGTVDILKDGRYNVVPIMSQRPAIQRSFYPNRRSELWFATASLARKEEIDISRIDKKMQEVIRLQACRPIWTFDAQGRRVVQPKDEVKKIIKRSPDSIDAMNLCYCYDGATVSSPEVTVKRNSPLTTWGMPNENDVYSQGALLERMAKSING